MRKRSSLFLLVLFRFMVVLICLIFSVLSTIEEYASFANETLFYMVSWSLAIIICCLQSQALNNREETSSFQMFFCPLAEQHSWKKWEPAYLKLFGGLLGSFTFYFGKSNKLERIQKIPYRSSIKICSSMQNALDYSSLQTSPLQILSQQWRFL